MACDPGVCGVDVFEKNSVSENWVGRIGKWDWAGDAAEDALRTRQKRAALWHQRTWLASCHLNCGVFFTEVFMNTEWNCVGGKGVQKLQIACTRLSGSVCVRPS